MRAMRAEQLSGYEGLKLVGISKPTISNGRSTSPDLITRALTGIGRATAVAFSRALGLNKADIKSGQVR